MIAEESTAWPGVSRPTEFGGLGFGLKWNMGWMHDCLSYMKQDPINRRYHHHEMTFALVYAWTENFVLPLSHDEVVHGKGSLFARMPGDHWQQLANLRAFLAYMWAHPGKQLLFMGGEFGQLGEWNDARGLDWWLLENADHQGMLACVRAMNFAYQQTSAMWSQDNSPEGFAWIVGDDANNNVFAWQRIGSNGERMISVTNFSPVVRHDYELTVPESGQWREVLNTDAVEFGGSGVGNHSSVTAHDGKLSMTLAPLATIWLTK
jgi:1,4-alpha-glucan branching enzyme